MLKSAIFTTSLVVAAFTNLKKPEQWFYICRLRPGLFYQHIF